MADWHLKQRRGANWAKEAEFAAFGKIRYRRRGYFIDLGTSLPGLPRFLYSDGGRPWRDEEDCRATLYEMRSELKRGVPISLVISRRAARRQSRNTVLAHLQAFAADRAILVEKGKKSQNLLAADKSMQSPRGVFADLLGLPLQDLSYQVIKSWQLSLLQRGLKGSTIHLALRRLRVFLAECVRNGSLQTMPDTTPVFTDDEQDTRPVLDAGQIVATLAEIPWPLRGLFLFLRDSCARPSEAFVVDRSDWTGDVIRVTKAKQGTKSDSRIGPRKSKRERAPVLVRGELAAWLKEFAPADGFLFRAENDRAWSYAWANSVWKKASAAAGVPVSAVYVLKRSVVTLARRAGTSTWAIANGAGISREVVPTYDHAKPAGSLWGDVVSTSSPVPELVSQVPVLTEDFGRSIPQPDTAGISI